MMAACAEHSCVGCKTQIEEEDDKVLYCYGKCGEALHYQCSKFTQPQIKFFEKNQPNLKWLCNTCVAMDKILSDQHSPINGMNKKLDALLVMVSESKTRQQTDDAPSSAGPMTRSRTKLAAVEDKKKYKYMENILNDINSKFISLPDKDVKRNNQILNSILTTITEKMKEKDPLFKAMYSRVFYGGSYYDGLRVGKPEEFDLDLLLSLPKYAEPVLSTSDIPGFVHLQITKYDEFMKQPEATPTYRNFSNLFDDKRFLDTQKVLAWMEGVVQKTLNDFPLNGHKHILKNETDVFEIVVKKGGPALTLNISSSEVTMDVDLVTCFVFNSDKWPTEDFRSNPVKTKPQFFIVPKKPNQADSSYWRMSFQEQERVLIDGKKALKPTIKLLKKLRDNLQHCCIASYYIKTVLLHIVETKDEDFWDNSLSYVFMTVLQEYKGFIERGNIPYYWNTNNNLIGSVKEKTLENMYCRLKAVVNAIEKNINEPKTIAKYLLSKEEQDEFLNSN